MAAETVHRAFSDLRAFVVPHDRTESNHPTNDLFTSQAETGPSVIHVGVNCSDAYLLEVWERRQRFPGLTLEQLIAARNNQVQVSEVQHG